MLRLQQCAERVFCDTGSDRDFEVARGWRVLGLEESGRVVQVLACRTISSYFDLPLAQCMFK